jgi:hypothetical protein
VAARRLHHRAPFGERQRERLLDVHVLAGLARVDHLERMPVVGRVDDHRVDVGAFEHAAIVGVAGRASAGLLHRELDVRRVDVAHARDLDIVVRQEGVEHLVAAVADADDAHPDAVVGAEHAARTDRRAHPRGGCGLAELAATYLGHGVILRISWPPPVRARRAA